jgi:hypothetical protein
MNIPLGTLGIKPNTPAFLSSHNVGYFGFNMDGPFPVHLVCHLDLFDYQGIHIVQLFLKPLDFLRLLKDLTIEGTNDMGEAVNLLFKD